MSDTRTPNKHKRASAISIGTKRRSSRGVVDLPPTVPDGGYGWVVVIAAFCVQLVFGGFLYSFGIYFVEFLKVFQEDRAKTAWIGSTLFGGMAVTGPMANILAKLYSCRAVVMLGTILLASALFCSSFCQSVSALIGVLGVMGGIGMGLLYLPTVVIVGYYFEKRRSLAIAICTSGTGLGGLIFPILMEKLIELYGWRGSLWVLSGFFVQCLFFGALLRPLTRYDMKKHIEEWHAKKVKQRQKQTTKTTQDSFSYVNDGYEDIKIAEEHSISTSESASHFSAKNNMGLQDSSNGHVDTIQECSEEKISCIRSVWSNFTQYADIWLLANPVFIIYTISSILGMSGFQTSSTFLPDYATSLDVSLSKISVLLSISGLFNTVSKIIMGWFCDKPWVDPIRVYSIILILGGVMTVSLPHMQLYSLLVGYTVVYGINLGAISLLSSVNLVDLLGMEKMSGALGLIMLLGGVGTLLTIPLAGFLYDISGSYLLTFSIFGSFSILSGCLCLPLRHFARCIFGESDN